MSKYTHEQKLKAVLNVVEHHMSYGESARQLGTAYSVIQRWVQLYNNFGEEGLLKKNRTYTGEFKIHVIEYMHEHHISMFETSGIFGIPNDSTVGKWERIYCEKGPQALFKNNSGCRRIMTSKPKKPKPQTKENIAEENKRLKMENAYLKKLNALVQERIQRENGKKQ